MFQNGAQKVTFMPACETGTVHHHVTFFVESIPFCSGKIGGASTVVKSSRFQIPKISLKVKHEETP